MQRSLRAFELHPAAMRVSRQVQRPLFRESQRRRPTYHSAHHRFQKEGETSQDINVNGVTFIDLKGITLSAWTFKGSRGGSGNFDCINYRDESTVLYTVGKFTLNVFIDKFIYDKYCSDFLGKSIFIKLSIQYNNIVLCFFE